MADAAENKVYYGLSNIKICYMKGTLDTDGNPQYDDPVPYPGSVEFTYDPKGDQVIKYADNIPYVVVNSNAG